MIPTGDGDDSSASVVTKAGGNNGSGTAAAADSNHLALQRNFPTVFASAPPSRFPVGIGVIYGALERLYPEQRVPPQINTKQKWWWNGPDPLDFISVYSNAGRSDGYAPPHWHYVSMGLSDLYGDNRVHQFKGRDTLSGLGFELTFRLKKEEGQSEPPLWPAAMMQLLARYIFRIDRFCIGDFYAFNTSIDGRKDSKISQILFAGDPQLQTVKGPLGTLEFIQIVGVFDEEAKAATKWNAHRMLDLLRQHVATGGPLLVTDPLRHQSVFEIDPLAVDILLHGIATDGMNLTAVNCTVCSWSVPAVAESCSMMSKLHVNDVENSYGASSCSTADQSGTDADAVDFGDKSGFCPYEALDICLDIKTAVLLPWMCKGRLQHRRHFSFRLMTANGIHSMITLCPPTIPNMLVSAECPYGSNGPWLQVFVSSALLARMVEAFSDLEEVNPKDPNLILPKTYDLTEFRLKFIIVP